MIQYTPAQIRRYAVVRPDWGKTEQVRSLYPPASQTQGSGPVVVAWDPMGPSVGASDPFISKPDAGRWCLAYDTKGHYATDDSVLKTRRVYRIFYYWQGEKSAYIDADTGIIASWLRDHDMWSGNHAGEWHDRMFSSEDREQERLKKAGMSESVDHLREIYDRHKDEIKGQFGSMSHYRGRGPNNGSKYHGGLKRPSRLRRWIDKSGEVT